MKRLSNLYQMISGIDNLQLADTIARKGKHHQYGVQAHDRDRENNIWKLHNMLVNHTYQTSAYKTFKVYEPKEREVYCLPYFPDRIAHHAIMNILEPIFLSVFTADSFACVKGRGIHGAGRAVRKALRNEEATRYCLKLDIKKFYPSIDHAILTQLLRRKIKDAETLMLLDGIIDSAPGLPIGNYLSQYFANFYLTYFDHWIKEGKSVQYYFRYADDIVILADSKPYLHQLLAEIQLYLQQHLKLTVKDNWQVFPVASRSIDFVGYRFYHTHTLLRKSIKKNFARKVAAGAGAATLASYWGWAKHCNSANLLNKLTANESIQRPGHKARIKKFSG